MEDVANYVDRILVMNDGSLVMDQDTKNVFARYKELEKIHLAAPQVTYVMNTLKERGFSVNTEITTVEEAKNEILKVLKG
jgi:energy-coupling factor transport system ATP-binding protein